MNDCFLHSVYRPDQGKETGVGSGWTLSVARRSYPQGVKCKAMALPEILKRSRKGPYQVQGMTCGSEASIWDWLIWAMLFHQALDPRIDLAQRHARIMTGHS